MSYLLEILGRGRVSELHQLFAAHFLPVSGQELEQLKAQAVEQPDHPDIHARVGLANLHRYRVAEAAESFRRAIRLKPDYLLPRLGLACCFEHQDRIEQAIEQLELAQANLPSPDDSPTVLLALGFCHERAGRPDRAAECYRDVLAGPADGSAGAMARERLAAIELASGRTVPAIEQYQALRDETGGGDPQVRLCLGNLYLKAGRPGDAVEEFSAAIALAPENWTAQQQLASALADNGQLREAVEHLRGLLEQQGDFPDLHVQLADLHSRLGEDEQAVSHYSAALELNGDYLEAAVKLATQHLRAGRFADAAVVFNRAVQISDRALTAYVGLAVAQKNAGQWSAALDSLEMACQLAPNSSLLFREMARLELKAALARQADAAFAVRAGPAEQASDLGADSDQEWGRLLELQVERHRQAVVERPSHADLHYRLGLLLAGQGDLQGAIEHYALAVQINPGYTKARIKLGLALKEVGQTERAIEELTAALDLNPDFADVHYRLGLLYGEQERFADAAASFQRSLTVNGANPEVRANLATCLESMGLLDRASAEWEKLADPQSSGLSPDSPFVLRARRRLTRLPRKPGD